MTHKELVEKAAVWLHRSYPIVATECVTYAGEIPDALGMSESKSHLIECKASRADFFADSKKSWRQPGYQGLGCYRSFLCEDGVIDKNEVKNGWGLLIVRKSRIYVVVEPSRFNNNIFKKEYIILLSLLRRIGQGAPKGISIKCYNYETGNNATLGVANDVSEKEVESREE